MHNKGLVDIEKWVFSNFQKCIIISIIKELELNGQINPPWGKSYYEGDLKEAYNEWKAVLTLKALITIDGFERISAKIEDNVN